jgi:hypothetical protein
MTIKTTGTSPSLSPDNVAAKLGRPEGQTPSDPALTPDNVTSKLGRLEGQIPANADLSPDPAMAKRPGGQSKGSKRL